MEPNTIKIVIIDDHPMVLEGMQSILQQMEGIVISGKAANALDAMELIRTVHPDVVITDINLPDISGIDLCKKIKGEFPEIKVIALSTFQDRSFISSMIQNGASGYLSKSSSPGDIEKAIHEALKDQIMINVSNAAGTVTSERDSSGPVITRREKEVLELIATGMTNKEIADKLFVSQSTIDSHRKNLMQKFEVMNAASLIAIATKKGII